ncbi:hypothetical protein GLW08_09665 [Pontibacillus yanchengensis]|uniref:Uncharacterized protein n=1 Tax=Pontibacillus yanchengensis TaxID=462910 RepID=A0ACC7VFX4_9BACI|nr:hypothetical protein [Pontibacillus yanchengensis]
MRPMIREGSTKTVTSCDNVELLRRVGQQESELLPTQPSSSYASDHYN